MKKIFIVLILVCSLVSASSVLAIPVAVLTDHAVPSDLPPASSSGNPYIGPKAQEAIVIHHSGSARNPGMSVQQTVDGYRNYHMLAVHPGSYIDPSTWFSAAMPAQDGFPDGFSNGTGYDTNDLDYHFVIGDISTNNYSEWVDYVVTGRPLSTVGWHSSNWQMNLVSIGICFLGMFDLVPPKEDQYQAGLSLIVSLMEAYKIRDIFPHSNFASKSCPGYAFPMDRLKADAYRLTGLYTDTQFGQWFRPYLARLGKANLITGYEDGSFRPNSSVTRAEFISMLWRSQGRPAAEHSVFIEDVSESSWSYSAVSWAYQNNIIDGYADGLFHPDQAITRAEVARVLSLCFDLITCVPQYSDVPLTHWAAGNIGAVSKAFYMNGDDTGCFNPDVPLTRAEAAAVITRLPITP